MNYLDDFHDRDLVAALARQITELSRGLNAPVTFMEVCGTHTMEIARGGLKALLPPQVRLVSGPGCPVCVTPGSYLNRAIALGRCADVMITTFGDMMRVPAASTSLQEERARGADIRVVSSPLDAVALAAKNPHKKNVFIAVGFETTAPAIAGSILLAARQRLDNFLILSALKTMPAPMEVLAADPDLAIDGFICPAHVSAVIGAAAYRPLARKYHVPCVVTGFQPVDVFQGLAMLIRQKLHRQSLVEIQYDRAVTWQGNSRAREIMHRVFVPCDAGWRGMGRIRGSGLKLRRQFSSFDAEKVIPVRVEEPEEHPDCTCGEILKGKLKPHQCPLFGTTCTPESPVGACMVSSEGSCAATFLEGHVPAPAAKKSLTG